MRARPTTIVGLEGALRHVLLLLDLVTGLPVSLMRVPVVVEAIKSSDDPQKATDGS